ncbi:MAG: hypothetical protein ACRCS9_13960 [Hyphomicrobium sp.]
MKGALRIAGNEQTIAPRVSAGDTAVPVAGVVAATADSAGAAARADAETYKHAAGVLGHMSARIGAFADHARQREGEQQGALAGADVEFRPMGDHTIFAEAYDRAGKETWREKIATELSGQMDAAGDAHPADPLRLTKALGGVREGLRSQLAPDLVPEFDAMFARKSTGLVRQAAREQRAKIEAEQTAAVQNSLAERMKSLDQQAYRLGLDETADKVLAGELVSLRTSLGTLGPSGQPLVAPGTQAKLLRDAEEQIARSRLIGAFSRLGGREEKERFIEALQERYAGGKDKLMNSFDVQSYETLIGHMRSEAARQSFGDSVAARQLVRDVKVFEKAAEDGLALSEGQMASMRGRLAVNGTPEAIESFNTAVATLGTVKQLQVLRPEQIERFTVEERGRLARNGVAADGRDLARVELAEKYLDRLKSDITQDPLGRAGKDGLIAVPKLDFSSGEAIAASIGQRVPLAEQVAGHYGREVKYFRPEERAQFAAVARKGGAELLSAATAITAGLGEHAPAALAEIAPDAPELAMVAGLNLRAGGVDPPKAVMDAARGIAVRQAKDFKPLAPNPRDARASAVAVTGEALEALPQSQDAAIAVANAIYEVRARQAGKTEFDETLWQQGYREALGERVVNNEVYGGVAYHDGPLMLDKGNPVVVPPNIKQGGFWDLVRSLRPDDLVAQGGQPFHGDKTPVSIASIRRARLIQAGDGKFALSLGTPEDLQLVKTADGKDYILDFYALEPILKKRRGDLYLGGN